MKYKVIILFILWLWPVMQICSQWYTLSVPTSNDLYAVDFYDEYNGWIAGSGGTLLRTSDGGQTWVKVNTGFLNHFYSVAMLNLNQVVVAGQNGLIIRTQDSGATWIVVQAGNQDYSIYDISIHKTNGYGIAGGSGNTILWTNDFGNSWSLLVTGFMNDFNGAWTGAGGFGVVAGVNAIFQPLLGITYGGQNSGFVPFYPAINNVANEGTARACFFFDENTGYVAGNIWTGQGFITLQPIWGQVLWPAQVLPWPIYGMYFLTPARGVVVGGQSGFPGFLAETYDGFVTWQSASITGYTDLLTDVILIGETGYAVGRGGVVLKRLTTVAAGKFENPLLPVDLKYCEQTRRIQITINIDHTFSFSLKLLRLDGSMQEELRNENVPAGLHQFFISLPANGSGIYLVHVMINESCQIFKIPVIR